MVAVLYHDGGGGETSVCMQKKTIISAHGDSNQQSFENVLRQWNIKVHLVLRENANNTVKAMGECRVSSLKCMAHTLYSSLY